LLTAAIFLRQWRLESLQICILLFFLLFFNLKSKKAYSFKMLLKTLFFNPFWNYHMFFDCRIAWLVWNQCYTCLGIASVDHVVPTTHFLHFILLNSPVQVNVFCPLLWLQRDCIWFGFEFVRVRFELCILTLTTYTNNNNNCVQ